MKPSSSCDSCCIILFTLYTLFLLLILDMGSMGFDVWICPLGHMVLEFVHPAHSSHSGRQSQRHSH